MLCYGTELGSSPTNLLNKTASCNYIFKRLPVYNNIQIVLSHFQLKLSYQHISFIPLSPVVTQSSVTTGRGIRLLLRSQKAPPAAIRTWFTPYHSLDNIIKRGATFSGFRSGNPFFKEFRVWMNLKFKHKIQLVWRKKNPCFSPNST